MSCFADTPGPIAAGEGGILGGLRVAVTRARGSDSELSDGLRDLGADLLVAPLIRVEGLSGSEAMRWAALGVQGYDWLVFTSAAGVEYLVESFDLVGSDRQLGSVPRIAAIGPKTAVAVDQAGLPTPALVAKSAVAESLLEDLLSAIGSDAESGTVRVLLPVAEGARTLIERGLGDIGVIVDRVTAYRTVPDDQGTVQLVEALRDRSLDLVIFASPSAVEQVGRVLGSELDALFSGVAIAAIGPITGRAVRERGLELQVQASEYTSAGLLRALAEFYS